MGSPRAWRQNRKATGQAGNMSSLLFASGGQAGNMSSLLCAKITEPQSVQLQGSQKEVSAPRLLAGTNSPERVEPQASGSRKNESNHSSGNVEPPKSGSQDG